MISTSTSPTANQKPSLEFTNPKNFLGTTLGLKLGSLLCFPSTPTSLPSRSNSTRHSALASGLSVPMNTRIIILLYHYNFLMCSYFTLIMMLSYFLKTLNMFLLWSYCILTVSCNRLILLLLLYIFYFIPIIHLLLLKT